MSDSEQTHQEHAGASEGRSAKKTYHKPEVRHEKVFETSALTCGKVQTTQGQCHSNHKTS